MSMTEYEKMIAGEVYDATDPVLLKDLNACKDWCWEYNNLRPTLLEERNRMLQQILGQADGDTFILIIMLYFNYILKQSKNSINMLLFK